MGDERIVIFPCWRAYYLSLISLVIIIFLLVIFARELSFAIVRGTLFDFGGLKIHLNLPILWFIPVMIYARVLLAIYDRMYIVDSEGVTSVSGLVSFSKQSNRVRYEDMRSLEQKQSLVGRILLFGDVEIGTAAESDVEVTITNVSNPQKLLRIIQERRDSKQDKLINSAGFQEELPIIEEG